MLARFEKGEGWLPLVTSYHRNRGLIEALVLELGLFAVLTETRASGG